MGNFKQIILIILLLGFSNLAFAANDSGILDAKYSMINISDASQSDLLDKKVEVISAVKNGNKLVEQKLWENILYNVVFKIIFPILVPVLCSLVFVLLRKIGLNIDLKTLDDIGTKAANYAEQKGSEWLKESGKKPASVMKTEWAWQLVKSIDTKLTASVKARTKLRKIILSKIPEAETKIAVAEKAKMELEEKQKQIK